MEERRKGDEVIQTKKRTDEMIKEEEVQRMRVKRQEGYFQANAKVDDEWRITERGACITCTRASFQVSCRHPLGMITPVSVVLSFSSIVVTIIPLISLVQFIGIFSSRSCSR